MGIPAIILDFLFQLPLQLKELKSEEIKRRAKDNLNGFCEKLKETYIEMIEEFKEKVEDHIENVCDEISSFEPNLSKIEADIQACRNEKNPKALKVYKKVEKLDRKMTRLREDLQIPPFQPHHLRKVRKLLKSTWNKIYGDNLWNKIFQSEDEAVVEKSEYSPGFLEILRQAVIYDDLPTVKAIFENPKMPPKSNLYLFQYQFEHGFNLDEYKDDFFPIDMDNSDPKTKSFSHLFNLAADSNYYNVVRYLMHFDCVDLLQNDSDDIPLHQLLTVEKIPEQLEKVIEEMIQLRPSLAKTCCSDEFNVLEQVIHGGSKYLCRLLIEKYGIGINELCESGLTPLISSIRFGQEEMFDFLLSMGASLTTTANHFSVVDYRETNTWSALHEACSSKWTYPIETILTKAPEMLKWKDADGLTAIDVAIKKDFVEGLELIYKHAEEEWLPEGLENSDRLVEVARKYGANKILQRFA